MNTTTNPGVTPADIEASILYETYFTAAHGAQMADGDPGPEPLAMTMICALVSRNGHTVIGEAHCQDPAKFDPETGRQAARANAIDKLWPMVVFAARQRALDLAVQP